MRLYFILRDLCIYLFCFVLSVTLERVVNDNVYKLNTNNVRSLNVVLSRSLIRATKHFVSSQAMDFLWCFFFFFFELYVAKIAISSQIKFHGPIGQTRLGRHKFTFKYDNWIYFLSTRCCTRNFVRRYSIRPNQPNGQLQLSQIKKIKKYTIQHITLGFTCMGKNCMS